MRTPMLDEARSRPTTSVRARRHQRSRIVVATGALTLLAVTSGAALALTERRAPAATPTRPAAVASATTAGPAAVGPTNLTPAAAAARSQGKSASPQATAVPATPASQGGASQGGAAPAPVLTNGTYPAFIRKVDADRRTMVVDVIQVFEDEAAVKAAIQDGRSREGAEYLITYIRNQNSQLRTLPVARDASIKFLNTCEGPTATHAVLSVLAKNATTSEAYYYLLTVSDGSVHRIVEHQAQPAC